MLATLPPEILDSIAYQLVREEHTPPVPLLCTCRVIYDAVSPETNPNLYARVFRELYDVTAAERRLGGLTPKDLLAELRTRHGALRRWRARYTDACDDESLLKTFEDARGSYGDPQGKQAPRAADSWVVFLMVIENDGKNIHHLLPDRDTSAHILGATRPIMSPDGDGYPEKTVAVSLDMWIDWLLDDYAIKARKRNSIRPFVFAAHEYDLFWAPWTQRQLPVEIAPSVVATASYMHNPIPQNLGCKITHFGREMTLAPPVLTQAAMLRFFASIGESFGNGSSSSSDAMSEPSQTSSWGSEHGAADLRALPRPSLESKVHDADFNRLIACTDGQNSAGLTLRDSRGLFAGLWEGNFTFLDYDAFRDMLSGANKAMYYGAYGEQAQVWRLRETVVRRTTSDQSGWPLTGPMTNAGYPPDLRPFAMEPKRNFPHLHPDEATISDALERQMTAWQGWEVIPDGAVDALLAMQTLRTSQPGSAAAADDLALLVTGVGHSAWGRFVLTGHVRLWDGLVYLVKEYAPFQRGKWLYRGYVLGGGVMVGRWRDTVTPEKYVGYEGTFILSKRST